MRTLFPLIALGLIACAPAVRADEPARALPAPQVQSSAPNAQTETAILAGGCFWGVEGVFEHVRGVRSVRSGYAGGARSDANYEAVSSGRTGHAESVEIVFDPREISYGDILQIFFSVATDPTQLNRQGPDHGPQYRSNIFTTNAEQARIARAYVTQLEQARIYRADIVTRIDPLTRFYPAEAYHQNFLARHPTHRYIVTYDLPKIAALRRLFPGRFTETRVS